MSNIKVSIFWKDIEKNYDLSKLDSIDCNKFDFDNEIKINVESINFILSRV